jgi:hypothetical protein
VLFTAEGSGYIQFLVADEVKNEFDPKNTPAKSSKRSSADENESERTAKQAKGDGISPTVAPSDMSASAKTVSRTVADVATDKDTLGKRKSDDKEDMGATAKNLQPEMQHGASEKSALEAAADAIMQRNLKRQKADPIEAQQLKEQAKLKKEQEKLKLKEQKEQERVAKQQLKEQKKAQREIEKATNLIKKEQERKEKLAKKEKVEAEREAKRKLAEEAKKIKRTKKEAEQAIKLVSKQKEDEEKKAKKEAKDATMEEKRLEKEAAKKKKAEEEEAKKFHPPAGWKTEVKQKTSAKTGKINDVTVFISPRGTKCGSSKQAFSVLAEEKKLKEQTKGMSSFMAGWVKKSASPKKADPANPPSWVNDMQAAQKQRQQEEVAEEVVVVDVQESEPTETTPAKNEVGPVATTREDWVSKGNAIGIAETFGDWQEQVDSLAVKTVEELQTGISNMQGAVDGGSDMAEETAKHIRFVIEYSKYCVTVAQEGGADPIAAADKQAKTEETENENVPEEAADAAAQKESVLAAAEDAEETVAPAEETVAPAAPTEAASDDVQKAKTLEVAAATTTDNEDSDGDFDDEPSTSPTPTAEASLKAPTPTATAEAAVAPAALAPCSLTTAPIVPIAAAGTTAHVGAAAIKVATLPEVKADISTGSTVEFGGKEWCELWTQRGQVRHVFIVKARRTTTPPLYLSTSLPLYLSPSPRV